MCQLEEDAALHTAGKMAASTAQDASQVEDRGSLLHPPPPSFSWRPAHMSPSALSGTLTPTRVRELEAVSVGPEPRPTRLEHSGSPRSHLRGRLSWGCFAGRLLCEGPFLCPCTEAKAPLLPASSVKGRPRPEAAREEGKADPDGVSEKEAGSLKVKKNGKPNKTRSALREEERKAGSRG